jgi:hypothetical protein
MTTKDLDQFLVDYQTEGTIIEVDALWLQTQLRKLLQLEQQAQTLQEQVATLKFAVEAKNDLIDVYKTIMSSRVRLNTRGGYDERV